MQIKTPKGTVVPPFNAWCDEIDDIMFALRRVGENEAADYIDSQRWRDLFDEGLSPEDAAQVLLGDYEVPAPPGWEMGPFIRMIEAPSVQRVPSMYRPPTTPAAKRDAAMFQKGRETTQAPTAAKVIYRPGRGCTKSEDGRFRGVGEKSDYVLEWDGAQAWYVGDGWRRSAAEWPKEDLDKRVARGVWLAEEVKQAPRIDINPGDEVAWTTAGRGKVANVFDAIDNSRVCTVEIPGWYVTSEGYLTREDTGHRATLDILARDLTRTGEE